MEPKHPLPGPGYFQWSTGGWFGSQLGCTAWMLAGATLFVMQAWDVTVIWLICFATANAIGTWLWSRRDRLRPYLALQLLLIVCGINGLIAMTTLYLMRPDFRMSVLRQFGERNGAYLILKYLGVMMALMAYFQMMEWSAKYGKTAVRDHSQAAEKD